MEIAIPGDHAERAIFVTKASEDCPGAEDRDQPVSEYDCLRDQPAENPQHVQKVLSAILAHEPLPAILQKIADAFVALCPEKGVAIFLLTGQQFQIEAEAGLPSMPDGSSDRRLDPDPQADLLSSLPALGPILNSGVHLCLASPLISNSGEVRGAFAVFEVQPGILDESVRETVRSLCDLARVAIEHGQLYEEVVYQSQFDRLTGLPNRLLLQDRLRQAMIAARHQGSLVAVCSIDLDRFKHVNETLGHDLGDTIFKLTSERLGSSLRDVDTLARQCGDDFILILRDLAEVSDAVAICERLIRNFDTPFLLPDRSLRLTASIGISIFPDHGDSTDQLLHNADIALRAAKHAGGGRAQIYSRTLGQQTRRSEEMVDALVNALAQTQFRMVYQPVFNFGLEIVGFEALLRWKHPTWGQITPLEFIPAAEKSGLIVAIGDWVMEEVCRQAMEWNDAFARLVKMFVNVSGVQLERRDFNAKVAAALERSGLPPDRLELEITESWVISDLSAAASGLRKLCDLGIGIAIDDFGTGYSTFNYLQELPLDTLKIDRSFVHRLDGSAANLSTVRAIAMLARQLGLKTVAEGVESEQHVRQLSEVGCDFMQGYFLSHPLNPDAVSSLLKQQQGSSSRPAPVPARTPAEISPTPYVTR
ncbi:MAG TPA: EAL domain-containing protein [Acidobacteriaceae bacterium]|nr:EAL domain-containing protein [Acidobacteriaceae bacterium]